MMFDFSFGRIEITECVVEFVKFCDCMDSMRCERNEMFASAGLWFSVRQADSDHVELLLWHSGLGKYIHFAYVCVSSILDSTDFAMYDLACCHGFCNILMPQMMKEVES